MGDGSSDVQCTTVDIWIIFRWDCKDLETRDASQHCNEARENSQVTCHDMTCHVMLQCGESVQAAFGCIVERELTLDGLEELREGDTSSCSEVGGCPEQLDRKQCLHVP